MSRKMLAILAVIAVTLAVVVVSIDARRSGNLGGSGGVGGSGGGGMAPNGNYDPYSVDCGNYNGNYDSLPGNYEISPLPSNYNGNIIIYNGPLPTVAWVKSYDSSGKDSARGVATDSKDSVIVVGNIGTIKYSLTGNPFWIAAYGGHEVATDSKDSVIVTAGSNYNHRTTKYDSHGNQLWNRTYTYDSVTYDVAQGVAVDSDDNIIVTVSSDYPNYNYRTTKYDSRGNQIWNRTYDSGGSDHARGVAVDSDDNVIVTGGSGTIKYDFRGNQIWTVPSGGNGVAVDSDDNVIVTGTSRAGGWHNYYTVKYDSSGNVLWRQIYDGGDYDDAYDVAVDGSGNVYVTGRSGLFLRYLNYFNYIYLTLKYDSDGNPLWKFTYDGGINDLARGVAVDSRDNVVVTGESNGDYFTIKLCGEEPQNDVPRRRMNTR